MAQMNARDAALWALWIGVPLVAGYLLFGPTLLARVVVFFVIGPLVVMNLTAKEGVPGLPYWGAWLFSTAILSVIWLVATGGGS